MRGKHPRHPVACRRSGDDRQYTDDARSPRVYRYASADLSADGSDRILVTGLCAQRLGRSRHARRRAGCGVSPAPHGPFPGHRLLELPRLLVKEVKEGPYRDNALLQFPRRLKNSSTDVDVGISPGFIPKRIWPSTKSLIMDIWYFRWSICADRARRCRRTAAFSRPALTLGAPRALAAAMLQCTWVLRPGFRQARPARLQFTPPPRRAAGRSGFAAAAVSPPAPVCSTFVDMPRLIPGSRLSLCVRAKGAAPPLGFAGFWWCAYYTRVAQRRE